MSTLREKGTAPYLEQWQRVQNWHERYRKTISAAHTSIIGDEEVDFFYAYVINADSLRLWVKELCTDSTKAESVKRLFETHDMLKIIPDIANGAKHGKIDRNPIDQYHSLVREYMLSTRVELKLLHDGKTYNCSSFIEECHKALKDLMRIFDNEANNLQSNIRW